MTSKAEIANHLLDHPEESAQFLAAGSQHEMAPEDLDRIRRTLTDILQRLDDPTQKARGVAINAIFHVKGEKEGGQATVANQGCLVGDSPFAVNTYLMQYEATTAAFEEVVSVMHANKANAKIVISSNIPPTNQRH